MEARHGSGAKETLALSSALVGFEVVDRRGEPVGKLEEMNLARTCMLVETGRSLLGKRHTHPVHASVVENVDLDAFQVTIAATKEQVEAAPEFRELDDECEAGIARYYAGVR